MGGALSHFSPPLATDSHHHRIRLLTALSSPQVGKSAYHTTKYVPNTVVVI